MEREVPDVGVGEDLVPRVTPGMTVSTTTSARPGSRYCSRFAMVDAVTCENARIRSRKE